MYGTILIALTSLDDKRSLDAKRHFEMVKFEPSEICKETIPKVVELIGDKVSTSKALLTLIGHRFIGCAIYPFHFSSKRFGV